jgi:hypothetical protein
MSNRTKSKKKYLDIIAFFMQITLGVILLMAALPKIRQPYDFLADVYGYELLSPKLGQLLTMTLPWIELLTAICLLGRVAISGALLVAAGMGAMFSLAVGWALYQGLTISCGCFGSASEPINGFTLIRAILISLFSFLLFLLSMFSSREIQKNNNGYQNTNA